jgi:hypothetical protein
MHCKKHSVFLQVVLKSGCYEGSGLPPYVFLIVAAVVPHDDVFHILSISFHASDRICVPSDEIAVDIDSSYCGIFAQSKTCGGRETAVAR